MVACGQKPKENERVVIQVIWGGRCPGTKERGRLCRRGEVSKG